MHWHCRGWIYSSGTRQGKAKRMMTDEAEQGQEGLHVSKSCPFIPFQHTVQDLVTGTQIHSTRSSHGWTVDF